MEDRAIVEHGEGDIGIGKNQKGVTVTLVERKSGFSVARAVVTKDSTPLADAIIDPLRPHQQLVRTITFDNGLEFARHQPMADALGCRVFFCDPCSSWQRGFDSTTPSEAAS